MLSTFEIRICCRYYIDHVTFFTWVEDDIMELLSTFAFLPFLGSPGPPENVKVDEITDTTAQLSWKEGTDNHSPVISYSVQARTPFSVGWQTATTGKGKE